MARWVEFHDRQFGEPSPALKNQNERYLQIDNMSLAECANSLKKLDDRLKATKSLERNLEISSKKQLITDLFKEKRR